MKFQFVFDEGKRDRKYKYSAYFRDYKNVKSITLLSQKNVEYIHMHFG